LLFIDVQRNRVCYSVALFHSMVLVYEIVAQCEPHKDRNILEVAVAIRDRGLTPKIPDHCPPLLREIMEMCWKKDPNERPNFETIYAMLSSRRTTESIY